MSSKPISSKRHIRPKKKRSVKGSQRAIALWLTGLPAAGKSTIAQELYKRWKQEGYFVHILDGDDLRKGLNADLGFSPEDRIENIRRVGEVARLLVDAGVIVIVALISPYREDREKVRARFAPGDFLEVYVKTSVAECEKRDPKGLYKKARQGIIQDFTGISAPYEEPQSPEIIIHTEKFNVQQCAQQILKYLNG